MTGGCFFVQFFAGLLTLQGWCIESYTVCWPVLIRRHRNRSQQTDRSRDSTAICLRMASTNPEFATLALCERCRHGVYDMVFLTADESGAE